jgi:hypothetical protein
VVLKRIKRILERSTQPQKPHEVEVKRQHSLQDDYDQTMMAISFAEAGAPEQALEVMRQRGLRKILVVTQGDAFTEPVMEYATLLAERMGYELIALMSAPQPRIRWSLPTSSICRKSFSGGRQRPLPFSSKKRRPGTSLSPMW